MTDSFTDKAMYNQHKEWEAEQKRQAYEDASAAAEAEMQAQEYQEAVELMADSYYDFTVKQSWQLSGFAQDIRKKSYEYARELLKQTYPDSKVLVLAVRARNQEVPQKGINICANCWIQTQNDMLRKGWIREVEE